MDLSQKSGPAPLLWIKINKTKTPLIPKIPYNMYTLEFGYL